LLERWGHQGQVSAEQADCNGFFDMLKRDRANRMKYPAYDTARADVFNSIERLHHPRMQRRLARHDLKFASFSKPSAEMG
jgi:putative transposase